MRAISVFISDVRNCQNKEQQWLRVYKELNNIRTKFKNEKVRAMCSVLGFLLLLIYGSEMIRFYSSLNKLSFTSCRSAVADSTPDTACSLLLFHHNCPSLSSTLFQPPIFKLLEFVFRSFLGMHFWVVLFRSKVVSVSLCCRWPSSLPNLVPKSPLDNGQSSFCRDDL